MNKFDQFNIKIKSTFFEGKKIKILKLLNREIIVHDFKITDSKFFKDKGDGKCLFLQISLQGEKRVVFTSSCGLIEMIKQVPENGFPFETIIIEDNERYKFT